MRENDVTGVIVDASLRIHQKLGPGLLESVYETILARELKKRGLGVKQQQAIPVVWDDVKLDHGFRADLVVEGKVIVEVKSLEELHPVHSKQLLTYLKLADKRVGLLINFGERYIRDGIHRVVNNLPE